jgi:predicted permease
MWPVELWRRVVARATRNRRDAEMADEIRDHLERRREQLIADGMNPADAAAAARRGFGNITTIREEMHEMWGFPRVESILQDIRYGARLLRRSPGFTAVAVLSLSLGIGSAAAVFNIADAVLFRPLAVKDPASLRDFRVTMSFGAMRKEVFGGDPGQADAIQRAADFADVIGFRTVDEMTVALPGMNAQAVRGEFVSPQYFNVLGVAAAAGRLLDPRDRGPSPLPVVVSERWWRTVMGADRGTPGQSVVINNVPAIIVGVAGSYRGLIPERPADVFLPLDSTALVEPAAAANTMVRLAMRLRPGVSTTVAEQKMAAIYRSLGPSMARGGELRLTLGDASRGISEARGDLGRPIALGLVLAAVLLVAACANTGGLLVARFAARQTEFGVRVAIGAGRGRLHGQLFVEALLLAALAAAAGLVMASLSAPLLAAAVPSGPTPIAFDVRSDWRLVVFAALVALAAAIVAGGMSLVHVLRTDPVASFGSGSRSIAGGRRTGLDVLVGSQIGCSLLLLVTTGAMARTLINLRHVDPGFDAVNAIAFTVDASGRLADSAAAPGLFAALHERVAAMPDVSRATLSQVGLLTSGSTLGTIDIAGWTPAADEDRWTRLFWVGPDFFETLGMRIVAGTGLGSREMTGRERVAVVTRQFATFYFGAPENALGRTVNRNLRIVGVVADGTYNTFRDQPARAMFLPFTQAPPRTMMTLIVRPAGGRSLALARIAAAIRTHDPLLKVTATSLADLADAAVGRERFAATVSAVLALLALSLSCAGVYATVAYAVCERRKELAVRFALGATTRDVVRLVVGHPVRVALIGMALAAPAAYTVLRAASSLLFGVPPFDAPIVAGAAIGLLCLAAGAAAVPAWRVATIDPQDCLRAS